MSGYSTHEQEAAAALLSSGGSGVDMSHIPEELRPFMALDAGVPTQGATPIMRHGATSYGGKALRAYNDDDDDDEDDEDDDDDIEDDEFD